MIERMIQYHHEVDEPHLFSSEVEKKKHHKGGEKLGVAPNFKFFLAGTELQVGTTGTVICRVLVNFKDLIFNNYSLRNPIIIQKKLIPQT